MQSTLLVTKALGMRGDKGLFDKPPAPLSSGRALGSPRGAVPACFPQPVGHLMPTLHDGPGVPSPCVRRSQSPDSTSSVAPASRVALCYGPSEPQLL